MDPRLKVLSREVAQVATDDLNGRDATDVQLLALLAKAALSRLEAALSQPSDEDARRDVKRARKMLQIHEPPPVEHNAVESKGLDLGQYAHTEVFEGKEKKAEKFARLMGGAKVPPPSPSSCHVAASPGLSSPKLHHATYAPPSDIIHRMTEDVEAQFNDAIHRKGKSVGLGAK